MSVHAQPRQVSLDGIRSALGRLDVVWPVLITAIVYLAFIGAQLAAAHGDPAIFVQFGHRYVAQTHPPAATVIVPGSGYDGQLYWLQAGDPLLRRVSTITHLFRISPPFSLLRVAYPALSWLLAGGQRGLLPWSMLAINLLAVLGLTSAFAVYARRRGWNPAWALVIGLAPGFLLATSRDLSDVLAAAGMLGAMLCFRRGHTWWTATLLTVSVLSREPMALAVVAVGIELAARCARAWRSPSEIVALLRADWPAVVIPSVSFLAWRAYVHTRPMPHLAAVGGGADTPSLPPFRGLSLAFEQAIRSGGSPAIFVALYLAITVAGIVAALWLLRRGPSAPVVMAALYGGLVLSLLVFPDEIALTRYTLPLFLALLLAGLEQRSRSALAVCAAATAMTAMLPLLAG